ncbi:Ig-like domain-containing protein [Peribacillus asahii]|uniref:Ig-like domain-containing protein n=1 Tax=Peribacillus asahii TaxID=228899 RepID=UPI0038190FF4
MRNRGILSLVAVGVLASSLSVGTVKAEGTEFELARKVIERQVEKPLPKGLVDSAALNQLQVEIKGSAKSSDKMGTVSRASSDDNYTIEEEYNDDFDSANRISFEKTTFGQLLPFGDIDVYKVVMPRSGLLLVGGVTDSYAINLGFLATQKDFVENSKLEYLGNEYEDGVGVRAYQAKAGTYYVGVFDLDNEYYINDNTEEDLYAIGTMFIDNVKPSKPTVKRVDDNDKVVKGKAEANSTVTVKVGSKKLGSAKASSNGNYSVKIKAQKKGTILSITAQDKAGNLSSKAITKVVKH